MNCAQQTATVTRPTHRAMIVAISQKPAALTMLIPVPSRIYRRPRLTTVRRQATEMPMNNPAARKAPPRVQRSLAQRAVMSQRMPNQRMTWKPLRTATRAAERLVVHKISLQRLLQSSATRRQPPKGGPPKRILPGLIRALTRTRHLRPLPSAATVQRGKSPLLSPTRTLLPRTLQPVPSFRAGIRMPAPKLQMPQSKARQCRVGPRQVLTMKVLRNRTRRRRAPRRKGTQRRVLSCKISCRRPHSFWIPS
mmetsp:Transcript_8647/g.25975  ORF Transcript_8647/g.25975 Transcript_8647/m.25975 type:complete len:251 (+) Transcript_8647:463-1215(+)